jgi:hypothetical protein
VTPLLNAWSFPYQKFGRKILRRYAQGDVSDGVACGQRG